MENANFVYQKEERDKLYSQIKDTTYVPEVQAVLGKNGLKFKDSYVRQVAGQFSYNEQIWDAIKEVIGNRIEKRAKIKDEVKQLVEAAEVS